MVVFWVSESACRVGSWGLRSAGWRLKLEAGGSRLELEAGGCRLEARDWKLERGKQGFSSMAGFWMHQVSVPGYPKEEGLLDFLGRLRPADRSVQMSGFAPDTFSRSECVSPKRG